jgi:hypothetical protein
MSAQFFTAGVARNYLVKEKGFQVPTHTRFVPSTPYPEAIDVAPQPEAINLPVPAHQLDTEPPPPERAGGVGTYFSKLMTCVVGGAYIGAVLGVMDLIIVLVVGLLAVLFSSGFITTIGYILAIGVLLYFGGIILAYIGAIVAGIVGGLTGLAGGLATGLICGFIYAFSDKDANGNVEGFPRYFMGFVGGVIFTGLGFYVNDLFWFQWDDLEWMGWVNIIAFAIIGMLIGSMNADDLESMTSRSQEDDDHSGMDLMAPFRLFGRVAGGLYGVGDTSANTVASVASNRTTIRQDGKTYHRGIDNKWRAEKDILGREKVERSLLGSPKIEKDILGRQKIERDLSGRPIISPDA